MTAWADLPTLYIAAIFLVLGLVLGSFGNVLILRIPEGKTLGGRSQCPGCKNVLAAIDLVPVLSYVLLRGRCRRCHQHISLLYPVIELLTGCLLLLALFVASTLVEALVLGLALWLLLLMSVIDARTQGIPDMLNIPFLLIGILYATLHGQLEAAAFVVGTGFLGLQWLVSRGAWMGSGDVLLSVGLCALLGRWDLVVVMLFVSYIAGACVAVFLLRLHRKQSADRLAFAPFLALGTTVSLVLGDTILQQLFYLP